jgi:hypothetical protein
MVRPLSKLWRAALSLIGTCTNIFCVKTLGAAQLTLIIYHFSHGLETWGVTDVSQNGMKGFVSKRHCRLDGASSSAVGCLFVLLGLQMFNARSQGIQSDRFTQTRAHTSCLVFGHLRWYKVGGKSDDW